AFKACAAVTLIPEEMAFSAGQLVEFLLKHEISVWYSVPSALIMMMEQGGLLHVVPPKLRAIIFAGEAFPVKHLRRLREHLPQPRMWNWYGTTETNVCTSYEVKAIPANWANPPPIGKASCGDHCWMEGSQNNEHGELLVGGPTVMLGYWGREPQAGRPY